MRRDKLAIQQLPSPHQQPRDQMGQRHFAGIGAAADHRFAEKGAAQRDAIETADQVSILPTFHTMGITHGMKLGIAGVDRWVDPCRGPIIRRFGA